MKSTKRLAVLFALVGTLACSACRPPTDPTFIEAKSLLTGGVKHCPLQAVFRENATRSSTDA